jgi:hypothetical protein
MGAWKKRTRRRVTALAQVNLTIRQNEFITLPWTP